MLAGTADAKTGKSAIAIEARTIKPPGATGRLR
jgi:hypothetical protein